MRRNLIIEKVPLVAKAKAVEMPDPLNVVRHPRMVRSISATAPLK
jgi:hypothetical protein